MSTDYSIENLDGITTIRLARQLGLKEILGVIDEVAARGGYSRRLWEVSGKLDFTSGEIETIAEHGKVTWPDPARVAYVATDPLSFGLLRMLEVYRDQQDYETRVFRSEQDALEWLRAWERA